MRNFLCVTESSEMKIDVSLFQRVTTTIGSDWKVTKWTPMMTTQMWQLTAEFSNPEFRFQRQFYLAVSLRRHRYGQEGFISRVQLLLTFEYTYRRTDVFLSYV